MDKLKRHTYRRIRLNDHTLDEKLQPWKLTKCTTVPAQSAGRFQSLPREILQIMLQYFDIESLLLLRCSNRRMMQEVDSLLQLIALTKHAPNALQGIVAIGTGRWITCGKIYDKLCQWKCDKCEDFGPYLYLITCQRVCFLCFSEKRTLLPLRYTHAMAQFGLKMAQINQLPRMMIIRGIYSPNKKKELHRRVVDYESAYWAGIELHGSEENMASKCESADTQRRARMNQRQAAQRHLGCHRPGGPPGIGESWDSKSANPLRFVAICEVPWLDQSNGYTELGFFCKGCIGSSSKPKHFRRRYIEQSFIQHIASAGPVQGEKHIST